jgi:hypothetical protein
MQEVYSLLEKKEGATKRGWLRFFSYSPFAALERFMPRRIDAGRARFTL